MCCSQQPRGENNAGHFTAGATLEATFDGINGAGSSLKGELTSFKANEEDVDWKVTLREADWTSPNFAITGTGTVWTIGGVAGEQTGEWTAQAYDDVAKDNGNVPTTVGGIFEEGFSVTHKMIGAFGATK